MGDQLKCEAARHRYSMTSLVTLRVRLRWPGWEIDHVSGSHRIFKHPKVGGHVSLSRRDGDDAKPYEERNVREAVRKSREQG